MRHQFQKIPGRIGKAHREAGPPQQRHQPLPVRRFQHAASSRQRGCRSHARSDRLAVPVHPVICQRLQGMPDRMSKVEGGAQALFALIPGDDLRLDGARPFDSLHQGVGFQVEDPAEVLLQKGEEGRVPDDAVLDHLGHAGPDLPLRQRPQHL